jgi:hypothetical protein
MSGWNGPESYYFHVPAGAASFGIRLAVPHSGEEATFNVVAPNGSTRLTQSRSAGDVTLNVPVEAAAQDAFWRLDVSHNGDVQFGLAGIPDWFAESRNTWFEPDTACLPLPPGKSRERCATPMSLGGLKRRSENENSYP